MADLLATPRFSNRNLMSFQPHICPARNNRGGVMSMQDERPGVTVRILIAPSGAWLVRDDLDHRGGRFRNRASALRFIRREFGFDARLHYQPWPTLTEARAA
jgi:hypothetical protein